MSRKAHIVGVGESQYTKWGKIVDETEHALAHKAIMTAVADAGLSIDDVDGLASFAEDRNEAVFIAAELGLPVLGIIRKLPDEEVEQATIYVNDFGRPSFFGTANVSKSERPSASVATSFHVTVFRRSPSKPRPLQRNADFPIATSSVN